MDVHTQTRPRLYPAKTQVSEVMGRGDIELFDPTIGEESDNDKYAHNPEEDAENCER